MTTTIKKAITGLAFAAFVFGAFGPGISQSEFILASTNPEDGMNDVVALAAEDYFEARQYLPEDHRSYALVNRDAQFYGGMERVKIYLAENFDYPSFAKENGIQGEMKVRFDIDENGKVSNVHITKGLHRSLNNELKRAIESMPNWIPALRFGFPTKCTVELPFKATLL